MPRSYSQICNIISENREFFVLERCIKIQLLRLRTDRACEHCIDKYMFLHWNQMGLTARVAVGTHYGIIEHSHIVMSVYVEVDVLIRPSGNG